VTALAKGYYYSFWAVAIGGIGLLGWALFFCWGQDYQDFSTQLLTYVDKLDWRAYFEQSVLPISRFQLLRWVLLSLTLLYGLLLAWSFKAWAKAAERLAGLSLFYFRSFKGAFEGLQPWQFYSFLALFLLFLVRTIFHIQYYALDYDEAWTYNHFSSKGVLISMVSPNNNHIFYTILSSLADYLPIPTKWVVRLPALTAGLLAFALFFAFMRKAVGASAALVSLAYFAFSSGMNFYSVLGRGYGWQMVFGILLLGAVYKILQGDESRAWKFLYVFSFVLGVYSVPTTLYLAFGLVFLYFLRAVRNFNRFGSFLKIHFLIGLLLIILHLPLLLTNGMNFLLDATQTGATASNASMLYYLHRVVDWMFWGRGSLLFWAYLILMFLLLGLRLILKLNTTQKVLFSIAYIQLAFPFAYALISWTQAPYRVWVYLVIFVGIMLGLWLNGLWTKRAAMVLPLTFLITSLSFYASETHYFLNWSAKFDKDAQKMANLLLEHQKVRNCYSFARYDKPLLEYYFIDADRDFKCWMPFKASKDYRDFEEQLYDAVLLDIEDYSPTEKDWKLIEEKHYQLIYENERVKLYLSPEIK
jgi:hypothetical protein